MKAVQWAILVYFFGLLLFYTTAGAYPTLYRMTYFGWDKGKDLLFFMALYSIIKTHRRVILPMLIFALIRFLWDIISTTTHIDKNHYQAVNFLLASLLLISAFICLKELRIWQRLKR